MSYPYAPIKVVVTGDVLTATDYNAEHLNHITYAVSEIGPVYSVKVYSATGDGATDDRANITTADAATGGATLFFPPGTYLIGNNLTISSPVEFSAGAKLSVASGKTVTFSSSVTAPATQIFSGSGTVVLAGNSPTAYAEWFGAVCDGSNDDALAIQSAVTALSTGGTIQLLSRPYTLKTAITVATQSLTIRGTTAGLAPIDYGSGGALGTRLIGKNGTTCITVNNVGYFKMMDVDMYLAVGATSATVGLYLESAFYPKVIDCRITNFSTAIRLTSCSDSYIQRCYLSSTASTVNPVVGINIDGSSSLQNPSVYISDCISAHGTYSGNAYGYWLHGTRINDVRFTDCEADGCTYGFFLDGSSVLDAGYSGDIVLQGCAADGNVTYGFYLYTLNGDSTVTVANGWTAGGSIGVYCSTAYNVTVSGMQCYGQLYGVYVGASSKNCTVIGNQILYASSVGIVVDGSPFCTVSSNQIKANSGVTVDGIELLSGATHCAIIGNNVNGTASSVTTGILINTGCDYFSVVGNNVSTTACTTDYSLNTGSNTHGVQLTAGVPLPVINGGTGTTTSTGSGSVVLSTGPTISGAVLSGTPNISGLTVSTALALDGSKNIVSVTNTGSGSNVLATSPTLVTPILGTPTSGALTNCTSIPVANATGALPVSNGGTGATATTGSGSNVLATSPTLVTPILGTPTSGALTNCTSIPVANATGALPVANGGTGATATTGSVNNVLSTSPTLVTPILGAASATSISFSSTTGVIGSTTNDSAAAGSVGETISSQIGSGSPTSLSTGTAKNVTSINVTAGDWDIFGVVGYIPGGTVSWLQQSIGVTSATADNEQTTTVMTYASATTLSLAALRFPCSPARFSFSTTTTVYLIAQAAFGTSMTAFGTITARRRR